MRSDRYMKAILTVIAGCLIGLTLTGIGLPDLTTRAEATVAPQPAYEIQGAGKPGDDAGPIRAPAATLPLRWKVAGANARGGGTYCGTAVIVTNNTNSAVNVEVEWFNYVGGSVKLNSGTTSALQQVIWVSGFAIGYPGVDPAPFIPDGYAQLDGVIG